MKTVFRRRLLQSLVVLPLLTLTGCGLGTEASSSTAIFEEPSTTFGTIKGGNVPIVNASIDLYQAGTGGYGVATGSTGGAIHLATYQSDDNTGQYSFTKTGSGTNNGTDNTWHCPTDNTDPLIYLIGTGGNPNGGTDHSVNNMQIVLAAMIGPCSTINSSTQVNLSELSTIGFAASFGQYMSPGTSTPGQEGISTNGSYLLTGTQTHQSAVGAYNAWLNYSNNLIYVPTGGIYAPRTYTGTAASVAGVQVTATAEGGKMVALANALASCVNSDPATSTNCAQLFDAAAKPILAAATAYGGTFPTTTVDTLQAALYLTALNPGGVNSAAGANTVSPSGACSTADGATTTNPTCVYDLIAKQPAFTVPAGVTAIATAPTDWSIGITYSAGGATTETTSLLTLPASNHCTPGGPFLWNSIKGAVDASGNIWIMGGDGTNTETSRSNIAEMSPYGQPLLCLGNKTEGSALTIDPSGNVWGGWSNALTNDIAKISPAGVLTAFSTTTAGHVPAALASDASGNIVIATGASGGGLYKLASGTGTITTIAAPVDTSTTSTVSLSYLALDSSTTPWAIGKTTSLYTPLPADTGHTYSVTSWKAATPTGTTTKVATYTFTGATAPPFVPGDDVTLSAFNSTSATTPNAILTGLVVSVATVTSTTFTASITVPAAQTASISTKTEATAKAAIANGAVNVAQTPLVANSYGIAIDGSGFVYTGATCCGTSPTYRFVTKATAQTSGIAQISNSTSNQAGISGTRALALDGAANIWVTNEYSGVGDGNATSFYPVSGLASSGNGTTAIFTALTPTGTAMTNSTCSTGVIGGGNTDVIGCPTGGGLEKADSQLAFDLDLDPSGNVWIINNQAGTNDSTNSSTIVQIVGVAVPVVTPIIPGSTLATKP